MKVIIAGMPKTGTKSMAEALQVLGYNVYDYPDHYQYLGAEWEKICTYGGSPADLQPMYENVDAVTDIPTYYFWEELLEAFPDAKIIVTTRDDLDAWWKSIEQQGVAWNSWWIRLIWILSPGLRRLGAYEKRIIGTTLRCNTRMAKPYGKPFLNETLLKMTYRRHYTYLKQKAPKDQTLFFSVKDGWEPLCKFLGKEIPSIPFPHKNVKGNILDDLFSQHPMFVGFKREAILYGSLLLLGTAFTAYKLISRNQFL